MDINNIISLLQVRMPLYRKKRRVQTSNVRGMEVYHPEVDTEQGQPILTTDNVHSSMGLETTPTQPTASSVPLTASSIPREDSMQMDREEARSMHQGTISSLVQIDLPSEDFGEGSSGAHVHIEASYQYDVERYAQLLRNPAHCPLVYKDRAAHTLVFCVPLFDNRTNNLSTSKFHFTGLRLVQSKIVCWCDCTYEGEWAQYIFGAKGSIRDLEAYMDTEGYVCPCAMALFSALDFGHAFKTQDNTPFFEMLEKARVEVQEHRDGMITTVVNIRGKVFLAVKKDEESKWGLVQNFEAANPKRPLCITCTRQKHFCEHVQYLINNDEVIEGNTLDDFERVVEEAIDSSTGRRRLSCISRNAIPESKADGQIDHEAAATTIKNRMAGHASIPNNCIPPNHESCTCGCSEWENFQTMNAIIFGLNSFVFGTCTKLQCAGCGATLSYDGGEDCILNYNNRMLFCWELFYSYSSEFITSPNRTFNGFIADLISRYGMAGCDMTTLYSRYGRSHLRDVFEDSWFDFITLQQCDYRQGFSCCEAPVVVSDGIMLSYALRRSRLSCLWGPSESDPIIHGSAFRDRVFLRDKKLRNLFINFAGGSACGEYKKGSGLLYEDYGTLRSALTTLEMSYLGFLLESEHRDGRVFARKLFREMIFNLGCSSPVCRLLPPLVYDEIDTILGRRQLIISATADQKLLRYAPVLAHFLRTCNKEYQQIPEGVFLLLQALKERSNSPFQENEDEAAPTMTRKESTLPVKFVAKCWKVP